MWLRSYNVEAVVGYCGSGRADGSVGGYADGSQNKAKRKLGTIGDAHVKGISRYFGCLYLIRVLIK